MKNNISANPLESGNDELERNALEECLRRQRLNHRVSVLIVSAGRCELAVKFARLGASVVVTDTEEHKQEVEGRSLASGFGNEIRFASLNLAAPAETLPGQPFDIIVIRRGLCTLPYTDARQTVRHLLQRLVIGGKIYLSILGLNSELSNDYPDLEKPVEKRFAPLAPEVAAKYDINGPVCLYTERNLFMLLLEAGASVLRTLTTTWGNVKGVAVRV